MRLLKLSPSLCIKILCLSLLAVACTQADAAFVFNMTRGVTHISQGIHTLHMTIFWICVVIGIGVFSVMFYAIVWHRKSRGAQAAHFHENTFVEIIWTLIPFGILVMMAIPATRLLIKMNDTRDSELSIKITGYQWRWGYEYLGEGISFISSSTTPQEQINNRAVKGPHYLREVDNPIVVPVGIKIRFLTTSNDVIHSWWVPALGIKRDAIPGFINEAWAKIEKPGIYRGQCAELCGALHGFMPIVIEAKLAPEYETWRAEKKKALAATTTPAPESLAPAAPTSTTSAPESPAPAAPVPATPAPAASTPATPTAPATPTPTKSEIKLETPTPTSSTSTLPFSKPTTLNKSPDTAKPGSTP